MVCVTLSVSLADLWGVRFFFGSQMQSHAKMRVGASLRSSCLSAAILFKVVFSERCDGSRSSQQQCWLLLTSSIPYATHTFLSHYRRIFDAIFLPSTLLPSLHISNNCK
ncbi:hypothetical protein XENOCAPTIV_018813 [Xenoophorus captivus]|uniref:Secreted protein n=1 Tax=Xenoophorus captivus TaxID=1517983 RepID=A0ABV0SG22_9TELE